MSKVLEYAFTRCERILAEIDRLDTFIETAAELERLDAADLSPVPAGDPSGGEHANSTHLSVVN